MPCTSGIAFASLCFMSAAALTGCFSGSSGSPGGSPSFDSGFPDVTACGDCDSGAGGADAAAEASREAGEDASIPPGDSGLDASVVPESGPEPFDASVCVDSGTGFCMIVLATGQGNPSTTHVDSTTVYWVQEATGSVMKVPIYGGTATTVAVGGGGVFFMTADSTSVYFDNEYAGTIMKAPIDGDGGQVVTLASGQVSPAAIAVDGTGVYWVNSNGGSIAQAPLAGVPEGGAATVIASGIASPTSIALDANNVYFGSADGTVRAAPKAGGDGGAGTVLLSGFGNPWGIAVDPGHLYVTDNVADGGVFVAPITGGNATLVAGSQTNPDSVAGDGVHVYWTTAPNGTGTVVMAPLDGGAAVTLATGQTMAGGISIDPGDVYWADFAFGRVLQIVE